MNTLLPIVVSAVARTKRSKVLVSVVTLMLALPSVLTAAPPDLTAPDAITTLKTNLNATPAGGKTC
jgi:hypothetical protein